MTTDKKDRLFDVRTLERNIKKGLITREDYNAYLEGLEDAKPKADVIESEFEEGVLDEDEQAEEDDDDE